MIEMNVEFVRVSMQNYNRVVILKEKESERYLLIWIGPSEAEAIAMRLGDVQPPRPQTHDLLRSVIESLESQVSYVVVNDLNNDTFYARIVLEHNGQTVEVDSRTSDAIALAVRAQVPIYADESVLDRAGIFIDREQDEVVTPAAAGAGSEPTSRVNEDELEKMSAFKDFIEGLDLDDFDKRK
jgi:bifunctional DNase/RNase